MNDRDRVANALALHPTDKLIDPVLDLLAEIRSEEREACGALLGGVVLKLLGQGEHDEAQIVARESARIRGTYTDPV